MGCLGPGWGLWGIGYSICLHAGDKGWCLGPGSSRLLLAGGGGWLVSAEARALLAEGSAHFALSCRDPRVVVCMVGAPGVSNSL